MTPNHHQYLPFRIAGSICLNRLFVLSVSSISTSLLTFLEAFLLPAFNFVVGNISGGW